MEQVRLTSDVTIRDRTFRKGSLVEVPKDFARALVIAGSGTFDGPDWEQRTEELRRRSSVWKRGMRVPRPES
jgi:hypothetical protein